MKAPLPAVAAALVLVSCGNASQFGTEGSKSLDPSQATATAPDSFHVKFETTKGSFEVECHREWGPHGVDRFYNLVKLGFFDDVAFFRVVRSPRPFVVQFGIHGSPDVAARWLNANIPPDTPKQSNTRGRLTFAMAASPDTRSTQLFINYGNNASLDKMGFGPICEVTGDGMSIVDQLYSGYGEGPTAEQDQIVAGGNKFLKEKHPLLDYIKTARLEEMAAAAPSASAAAVSAEPAPSASAEAAPVLSASAMASAAPSASAASSAAPRPSASAASSAAPPKK